MAAVPQPKSCCIQATKPNSRRWLRCCREADVAKKEKPEPHLAQRIVIPSSLNTDATAEGSREEKQIWWFKWEGRRGGLGLLCSSTARSLPDLGLATAALEALGRQIAQKRDVPGSVYSLHARCQGLGLTSLLTALRM